MAETTLKPTEIQEMPFPDATQETQTYSNDGTKDTLIPKEISPLTFPKLNIATGLKSTTFDSESREILANFIFTPNGAISVGQYVSGVSGDIRISPAGIIARNSAGVTTFSIDGTTGVLVVSGYIQVGGAAADINAGATTIAPGKVLISGATVLSDWSSGANATFIDGGKIYADSITATQIAAGTITGAEISSSTSITAGSSNDVAVLSGSDATYRIWAGHATAASAPFSVTKSGDIKATGGNIAGWSISSSALYKDTGVDATSSGMAQGDYPFYAGKQYASRASAPFRVNPAGDVVVNNLTAYGKITSTTGNERVAIDNDDYIKFYAGGNLKAQLRGTSNGAGGVHNSGDFFIANNRSYHITSSSGSSSEYGGISITSGNQFWLTLGTDNTFYIKNNAQNVNMFTVSGTTTYSEKYFQSGDNYIKLNGKNLSLSDNNLSIWHDSSGGRDRNNFQFEDGCVFGVDRTGSWIHINGNDKSAIMGTSKGYNALYCAESPEVWFFDFCKNKKEIDPMFLEVTEGEMEFIKCESGKFQVWRRRRGHAGKRFESKTALQFYKNESFLKLAK